jgi:hypothetical protein
VTRTECVKCQASSSRLLEKDYGYCRRTAHSTNVVHKIRSSETTDKMRTPCPSFILGSDVYSGTYVIVREPNFNFRFCHRSSDFVSSCFEETLENKTVNCSGRGLLIIRSLACNLQHRLTLVEPIANRQTGVAKKSRELRHHDQRKPAFLRLD